MIKNIADMEDGEYGTATAFPIGRIGIYCHVDYKKRYFYQAFIDGEFRKLNNLNISSVKITNHPKDDSFKDFKKNLDSLKHASSWKYDIGHCWKTIDNIYYIVDRHSLPSYYIRAECPHTPIEKRTTGWNFKLIWKFDVQVGNELGIDNPNFRINLVPNALIKSVDRAYTIHKMQQILAK